MGNPTRLQILHALREHFMNVGELVQATEFGQPLVSRYLNTLRNAGIVKSQRHGNEMIYQLTDGDIGEVCDLVRKVLSAQMHRQTDTILTPDIA